MKELFIILIFFTGLPTFAAEPVSFEREVLPLLEHRCNECHHPEEMKSGLDLTRLSTMLRGGDEEGPALVPGKPNESPMILMLNGKLKPRMPKKADPLPQNEIDLLSRWIAEGAVDDTPEFSAEDVAFFEREVRPILYENCYKCHAGDDAENGLQLSARHGILIGGEHGPAAVPSKPEKSLLIAAIKHEGRLKMPKGGDQLSETKILALEEWIRRGLPWPSNQKVLTRKKLFTISDADRNHWSFRSLPKTKDHWSIDSELQSHWDEKKLTPAPQADANTLLRRISYDLIGYPPSNEEIDAFLKDRETIGPDAAFAKVIDRLLASPQFGWRWGRHWLDYTRNGANGQPNRGPLLNSNRYAAWVADCFNQDRPWDWFARVHLAGDKMPDFEGDRDYSIDQALAAAIPLNGPRTFQEAQTETFVLMDKLDEGVEFMGRSLMGISLECARCHDHKFDPISQRDYYALLGYYQSSWFAPVAEAVMTRDGAEESVELHREKVAEQARLNGFIRKQSIQIDAGGGGRTKAWQTSQIPKLEKIDKRLRELELMVFKGELDQAEKENKQSLADDLRTAITGLEDRLKNYQVPEYSGFGSLSGYAYFIGGHKSQLGLIKRATELEKNKLVEELEQQLTFWTEERERWIERSRYGGYAKSDPEVAELAQADTRIEEIKKELSINPSRPWIEPSTDHLIVRVDGGFRRAEDLPPLDEAAKAAGLQFNSNNPDRVFMHPYYIGDARLLSRGDALMPRDLIPRGTPEFFGESPTEAEGSGRLQLANWITSPGSIQASLVARSAVNRAWQNLFGEALCRTPKELGRLGDTPELPEIVDGLAARFIENKWSLKTLLREIVMSKTYRQSSITDKKGYKIDPDNRWFARQSVRRLQSEAIMNGLAWLKNDKRFADPDARNSHLPGHSEFTQHFDGPTSDDLIERRTSSITPSQALFLMNSKAAARGIASEVFNRVRPEGEVDLLTILPDIYKTVLQRTATDAEISVAKKFLLHRRAQTGATDPGSEAREFIHLLLCSNELIYLD